MQSNKKNCIFQEREDINEDFDNNEYCDLGKPSMDVIEKRWVSRRNARKGWDIDKGIKGSY